MKRKTKKRLSILLIVGILFAAVAGVSAFAGREKADEGFKLVDVSFERGGLDEAGKYSECKDSIYTKEAFDCGENVRIKLDFDSTVSYKVYFYGEDNSFMSATDEYEKTADIEVPENATCARIVVTPMWDSEIDEDDQIIRVWEINKYAKQLTVMVAPTDDAKTKY